MADRKRAPKQNALNQGRALDCAHIIDATFRMLQTVTPPDPSLYASVRMFDDWKAKLAATPSEPTLPIDV